MRQKDQQKQTALFNATIKVVNDIGFAASSVSKIAKEAGISPATLYIYHENKEDLLVSTYVTLKKRLGKEVLKNYNESDPIRDILKKAWENMINFWIKYPEYLYYIDQFSYSPFSNLVNSEEVNQYFLPLYETISFGIERKILKNVPLDVMGAFIYVPINYLANPLKCTGFEATKEGIEQAFSLAWDAIKR